MNYTKKTQLIILILTLIFTNNSEAQQLTTANQLQQINELSNKIIGTWVSEEDDSYKLIFLADGTCKEYEDTELLTTYFYVIINENCEDFSATNVFYLKWEDLEDLQTTCFEVQKITDDTLSIMIIDKAKILFFNKQ